MMDWAKAGVAMMAIAAVIEIEIDFNCKSVSSAVEVRDGGGVESSTFSGGWVRGEFGVPDSNPAKLPRQTDRPTRRVTGVVGTSSPSRESASGNRRKPRAGPTEAETTRQREGQEGEEEGREEKAKTGRT